MSRWIRRFQILWNLSKASPPIDISSWDPGDTSQLSTFLKTTSAGKKLTQILRNGAVEQAMRCMTDDTAKTLWLGGAAAGYTAAIAVLDELAGANSQAEEAAGTGSAPSVDLEWLHNPQPQ